jgi:DNA-binding MarR family transcriptional regulator
MKNSTIDTIIENLFYVLPFIHKKLLKIDSPEIELPINLSRIHVAVMGMIKEEGALPISEIARRLLIPKPQMTHVITNLVSSGIINKKADLKDRRITNIVLTETGKTTFDQIDESLKNQVRKNLSYLSENELEELSTLLTRLRELGSRLASRA